MQELSDDEPDDAPEPSSQDDKQLNAASTKANAKQPLQVRVNFLKDVAGYGLSRGLSIEMI